MRSIIYYYSYVVDSILKKLGVFIPILLTIVLAFSMVPSAYAATEELKYDDGSATSGYSGPPGYYVAVKFSLPFGWNDAKLITARYYIFGLSAPTDFNVHIFGSDGSTRLLGPLETTATTLGTWLDVDLSSYNIIVSGDFYVELEFIESGFTIGLDNSDPDGRSYENNPDDWHQTTTLDIMIRAVVEQYATPVGGIFYSPDKASILSPWLAVIGIISSIAVFSIIAKKRRA
jgi:hypothetical protein